MSTPSDISSTAAGASSPALPDFTSAYLQIDDVHYPSPAEIRSAPVPEDWLLQVEDALTEARNGVTAIAWPFVLAALIGFLALLADVADDGPDLWAATHANPYKSIACCFLLAATILAFVFSDRTSNARRRLVGIRHGYLRRQRQLSEAGQ